MIIRIIRVKIDHWIVSLNLYNKNNNTSNNNNKNLSLLNAKNVLRTKHQHLNRVKNNNSKVSIILVINRGITFIASIWIINNNHNRRNINNRVDHYHQYLSKNYYCYQNLIISNHIKYNPQPIITIKTITKVITIVEVMKT